MNPATEAGQWWRTYRHIGSCRAHSTPTLAHIARLYRPHAQPSAPQAWLAAAALTELQRRAAAGRVEAIQALHMLR